MFNIKREVWAGILFLILFLSIIGVTIADVLTDGEAKGVIGNISEIFVEISKATLGLVAFTYILVEVIPMLYDKFKKREFKEGKIVGEAEKDAEWRQWYEKNKDQIGALDPPPPPKTNG